MSTLKRCKVVMLRTNQPSILGTHKVCENKTGEYTVLGLRTAGGKPCAITISGSNSQHLYITSEEEIKKGDWTIHKIMNIPIKYKEEESTSNYKKIIATTDLTLRISTDYLYEEYSLPEPSQSFIEKYVELYNTGNPVDYVDVEYKTNGNWEFNESSGYKGRRCVNCQTWNYPEQEYSCDCGISPKINIKDNTVTIKRVKDSWNKKEILTTVEKYLQYLADPKSDKSITGTQWWEENL